MDSVSLLTGLLQHFSPTGQESGAVTFLVNAMQQLDFRRMWIPSGMLLAPLNRFTGNSPAGSH
jgi:hypothetical protein